MNLEDMRIAAQLHVGISMEKPFARRFANEAMIQLCNLYPKTVMRKKKENIDAVGGEETTLPQDCYLLTKVKKGDRVETDYEIYGDTLEFERSGTYTIEYLKKPDPLGTESDVPQMPEAFHPSIALFIASREKFRLFGEEDVDSIRLMREFAETASLANTMVSKHGRRRMIKPREWW